MKKLATDILIKRFARSRFIAKKAYTNATEKEHTKAMHLYKKELIYSFAGSATRAQKQLQLI